MNSRRRWSEDESGRRRTKERATGNTNGNDGNGVAGIEGGSGVVGSTTLQESESEGTTGGNGMVPPKDTKEGDEAEGAEYLMEIGEIDSECSCSTM